MEILDFKTDKIPPETDPGETAHETTTVGDTQVHDNTEIQMSRDPKEDADYISERHGEPALGNCETGSLTPFQAFESLITAQDVTAFRYWLNSPMPQQSEYRYMCIPHVPGFWDHIVVGCNMPNTEAILASDVHTPRLLDVNMGAVDFHWCCFVFVDRVILAMWCSMRNNDTDVILLPITDRADNRVRTLTSSKEFNSMLKLVWMQLCLRLNSKEQRQI
ncbi:hypothetical protein ACER0C_003005 [Sarotherodon galilaeus]